jgi:hypothetical protein
MPTNMDFSRMNLAAGGRIRDALVDEHRVLDCMTGYFIFFVVAHADDADRARAWADELHTRHEGLRDVFTVLLTDAHFAALDADVDLNVPVLIAADNHAPADTAIKVNNDGFVNLTTEYGKWNTEVTTTRELRAGDVFASGSERLGSGKPEPAVHRAVADYDPGRGEIRDHLVDPGWRAQPDTEYGALGDGPNQIVFRIINQAKFYAKLDLVDLQPATA